MPETGAAGSFREAGREQTSLLAPLEKRALARLAAATPAWIHSDHLTLLGFAAMLLAGGCYALARYQPRWLLAAIVCLALNWLGDSLDGTLARVRQRQRPRYGFYVDHMTDAFGTLFLVLGMGLSGYMTLGIAVALLVVYLMLSIQSYLAAYALGTFQLSYWKFSPTELRLLLAAGNLALLYKPVVPLWGHRWLLFDIGGAAGIAGMSLMLVAASLRNTVALYRAERLPR